MNTNPTFSTERTTATTIVLLLALVILVIFFPGVLAACIEYVITTVVWMILSTVAWATALYIISCFKTAVSPESAEAQS